MPGNPISVRLGSESRVAGSTLNLSVTVGTGRDAPNRTGFFSDLTPGEEILYAMVGGTTVFALGPGGLAYIAGINFITVAANPGDVDTLWVNSTDGHLYFGAVDLLAGATGSVSGSGVPTQVAFWSGTTTLTGSNSFVWDGTTLDIDGAVGTTDTVTVAKSTAGNAIDASVFGDAALGAGDAILRFSTSTVGGLDSGILHGAGSPSVNIAASGASSPVFTSGVAGDAEARFSILADGTLLAGNGVTPAGIMFQPTASTINVPAYALALTAGNAASPALTFIADGDTGIYSAGANTLGIALAGVNALTASPTAITTVPRILVGGTGSAAAPLYSFSGDTDTGIYNPTANVLSFSIGGTNLLTMSSTGALFGDKVTITDIVSSYGTDFAPQAANPGDTPATTVWVNSSDGNKLYFGSDPLATGGGITGTGSTNQVAYWSGATSITGDSGFTWDGTNMNVDGEVFLTNNVNSNPTLLLDHNGGGYSLYIQGGDIQIDGGSLGVDSSVTSTFAGTVNISQLNVTSDMTFPEGEGVLYVNASGDVHSASNFVYDDNLNSVVITSSVSASTMLSITNTDSAVGLAISQGAGTVRGLQVTNVFGSGTAAVAYFQASFASRPVIETSGGFVSLVNTPVVSNAVIRAGSGLVSGPSFAFSSETNTGMYLSAAGVLTFATVGVDRLSLTATAATFAGQGIFPGTTSARASIRLPHGVVPTTPVDGDVWTTSAGMFVRVNGVTVGPLGAAGTPGGANSQIQFNNAGAFDGGANLTWLTGSNQLVLGLGTVAAPAYSFLGDLNTGIYGVGADTLGISTNGVLRLSVSTSAVAAALPITSTGNISGVDLIASGNSLVGAGIVGAPSFSFSGDLDTGLFNPSANTLNLVTGAATRISVNASAITTSLAIQQIDGAAVTPSYSFTSDTNTGLYSAAADSLGIAAGGTSVATFSGANATFAVGLLVPNGAVGTPSVSFTSDTNTGIYRSGADVLGFAAGGVAIMTASATTVTITGKLTVTGLIDPTGMEFTQQATNPGGVAANTIWINSADGHLYRGSVDVEATGGGGTPAGADTEVQFNNSGSFGANANFTYDGSSVFSNFFTARSNGGESNAAFSFVSDAGSGLWFDSGSTELYITSDSTNRIRFASGGNSTNVIGDLYGSGLGSFSGAVDAESFYASTNGGSGSPVFTFGDAPSTTGFYYDSSLDTLHVEVNGNSEVYFGPEGYLHLDPLGGDPSFTANGNIWFDGSTLWTHIGGIDYDLLSGAGPTPPAGANGDIQYNNSGDFGGADTGSFLVGDGSWQFSSNGRGMSYLMSLTTGAFEGTVPLFVEQSDNGVPAIQISDQGSSSTNWAIQVNMNHNQASALRVAIGSILMENGYIYADLGNTSNPSIVNAVETTTGFYWQTGTPLIGMSVSATSIWSATASAMTMAQKFNTSATTATRAGLNLPHGTVPTTPVNGDLWTTTAGVFARINGVTVGPFGTGGATSPAGSNTQVQFNNAGSFGASANLTWNGTILAATGVNVAGSAATTVAINETAISGGVIRTSAAQQFSRASGGSGWYFEDTAVADGSRPFAFLMSASGAGVLGTANRTPATQNTTGSISAITWTNTAISMLLPVGFAAGSAAAPSMSFTGDLNTGIYNIGADQLGFSTNGTLRQTISTTQVVSTLVNVGPNGTAALPTWSFSGDPNTGIYNVGADQIGMSTNGTLRQTISTTQVINTLVSVGPAGTAALPSYSFSGDPNTGIYNVGADQLGFSTNGVLRLTIGNSTMTSTGAILIPDGTNANPGLAFASDPTTGIYTPLANSIYFSLGGVLSAAMSTAGGPAFSILNGLPLHIGSTGGIGSGNSSGPLYLNGGTGATDGNRGANIRLHGPSGALPDVTQFFNDGTELARFTQQGRLQVASGGTTPTAPEFSFLSDTNTGMYQAGADQLGFSSGGSNRLTLTTTRALFNATVDLQGGLMYMVDGANPVILVTGTGSPEGAVTAGIGSLYLRNDGGASTTLYVKTSGVGNTGWTAK